MTERPQPVRQELNIGEEFVPFSNVTLPAVISRDQQDAFTPLLEWAEAQECAIASYEFQLGGIEGELLLFHNDDNSIPSIEESETPLGPVTIATTYVNDRLHLTQAPLNLMLRVNLTKDDDYVTYRKTKLELTIGQNKYELGLSQFDQFEPFDEVSRCIGENGYYYDLSYLVKSGDKQNKVGVALPYDAQRLAQIRGKFVQAAAPTR